MTNSRGLANPGANILGLELVLPGSGKRVSGSPKASFAQVQSGTVIEQEPRSSQAYPMARDPDKPCKASMKG